MKLSEATVDAVAIEDGEWIGDIPEMEGLRLRVRGVGNAAFRRMQGKLIEAVPRAQRVGGRLDPETVDRITGKCLVGTVLLDWEGLENDDGSPLAYSKEMAARFMSEAQFRRLREAVQWAATIVGERRVEDEKADGGNSATA